VKVGIVAPVPLIQYSSLTRVRYFYSSLLKTDSRYEEFYKRSLKEKCITIVDYTSPGWKRELLTINYYFPEALLIVLPSSSFDKNKTLNRIPEYLENLENVISKESVVGCLEGTTKDELVECRKEMKELGITEFALPSHNYRFGLELEGILLYLDNWGKPLEVPNSDSSILITSLPTRLGLQGRLLQDFKPTPSSLTLDEEEDKFPEIIRDNIEEVLDFYGD